MTREQEQIMEGFYCGLTSAGTLCDYRRGSAAWGFWWIGFNRAKELGADGAYKLTEKLYKEYAA